MLLKAEQLDEISKLAGINYSIEEIAMYLDVDPDELEREYNLEDSDVRYHYDRGRLVNQAQIDMANMDRAKDGNLTSIEQWKKDAKAKKLENFKRQLLFDKERKEYESIQALVEKGETRNLPEKLVQYFEQIDYIRCVIGKFKSKTQVINMVALKWPQLSKYVITNLYYESINFFNLDNEVKPLAWANFYADKLDNMSLIALEMGLMEEARRCLKDAAEMRGVGKDKPFQIPPELLERKPILYTIKLQDLGIEPISRNVLSGWIENLPITSIEKRKAKQDAMIEDVTFELLDHEEN